MGGKKRGKESEIKKMKKPEGLNTEILNVH